MSSRGPGNQSRAVTRAGPLTRSMCKNAKQILDMPNEVLAICLKHTGNSVLNARLTCHRFNEVIVGNFLLMNVIEIKELEIKLTDSEHFYISYNDNGMVVHESDFARHVKFFRPKALKISCDPSAEVKPLPDLANPWFEAIEKFIIDGFDALPFLNLYPHIDDVKVLIKEPKLLTMPYLTNYMGSIRKLDLTSSGENDFSLDVLSAFTQDYSNGLEDLNICDKSLFHMSALLRFIETARFAPTCMIRVAVYGYGGHWIHYENSPEYVLEQWNRLQKSRGVLYQVDLFNVFEYRGTSFIILPHYDEYACR